MAEDARAIWSLCGPDGFRRKLLPQHFPTSGVSQLRDDAITFRDDATVWPFAMNLATSALVYLQHPTRHTLRQVAEEFDVRFDILDRHYINLVAETRSLRIKQMSLTEGHEWPTSGEFCAACYVHGSSFQYSRLMLTADADSSRPPCPGAVDSVRTLSRRRSLHLLLLEVSPTSPAFLSLNSPH